MKFSELVKRQDSFLYFMIFVTMLGVMAAIFTVAKRNCHAVEDLLDLAAYALPLLAGVAAGGGIYFKDDAEVFFGASCFLLVAGFASYMEIKGIGGAVLCAAVSISLVWVFSGILVDIDDAQQRYSTVALTIWVVKRSFLALALLAATLYLLHDALANGVQKGGSDDNAQQHSCENSPHHD